MRSRGFAAVTLYVIFWQKPCRGTNWHEDVTNIVRAVADGTQFYGFRFAVPVAAADGFDSDHAALLRRSEIGSGGGI